MNGTKKHNVFHIVHVVCFWGINNKPVACFAVSLFLDCCGFRASGQ